MPSPRKGSPVTGVVAPGTGAGLERDRRWTTKAGSVSKLTVAMPALVVELGSVTNDVPFHVTTCLTR